jgi:hypothetical protein
MVGSLGAEKQSWFRFTFVHAREVFQEPQELVPVGVQYTGDLRRLFLVNDKQLMMASILF